MYFDELRPRSSRVPEYWNSAAPPDPLLTEERFAHAIELLPRLRSSRPQLAARLLEIAQKARRNLRQDDWGPTRGEQADALRKILARIAEMKAAITDLGQGESKAFFDALENLRFQVRTWSDLMELIEDAASTCNRYAASPAFSNLASFSDNLISYPEFLDDNTCSAILNANAGLHVEGPPQAESHDLAESVGAQLQIFAAIHLRALEYLAPQRGPTKHFTMCFLVCALAEIYHGETGEQVTHYLDERGQPASQAGKFIRAVVLATRPQKSELLDGFIDGLNSSAQKWLLESALISQVAQALKNYISEVEKPPRRGRKAM